MGIFPEGRITRSGRIESFQPGFLSILKKTGARVIPVHLGGLWGSIFSYEGGRLFWKWPRRRLGPVTIRFGRPMAKRTDACPDGHDYVVEARRAVKQLAGA